jgi:hypothetical protein
VKPAIFTQFQALPIVIPSFALWYRLDAARKRFVLIPLVVCCAWLNAMPADPYRPHDYKHRFVRVCVPVERQPKNSLKLANYQQISHPEPRRALLS